jgi:L-asparagine transporter-like permease
MKKGEKGLGPWQLTMMALGTVIGGSFFLGSAVGRARRGSVGAAGLCLRGRAGLLYPVCPVRDDGGQPDSGSFRTFASQVFGEGTGFVVGWVYWTGMVLAMSSEAAAVSILVRGFFPGVSAAAWAAG